jgi:hypothetical protein
MPAGDPQRTWFPEMIDILRARWHVGLPFAALTALRNDLNTMLHQIRAERHIRPPVIRCSRCGRALTQVCRVDALHEPLPQYFRYPHLAK